MPMTLSTCPPRASRSWSIDGTLRWLADQVRHLFHVHNSGRRMIARRRARHWVSPLRLLPFLNGRYQQAARFRARHRIATGEHAIGGARRPIEPSGEKEGCLRLLQLLPSLERKVENEDQPVQPSKRCFDGDVAGHRTRHSRLSAGHTDTVRSRVVPGLDQDQRSG